MPMRWWSCPVVLILLCSGCGDDGESKSNRLPDSDAIQATVEAKAAVIESLAKIAQPKAVTSETTYNFGTMEMRSQGAHEFAVSNGGTEPLQLTVKETSCKCTAGKVSSEPIALGQSTVVRLEWNSGSKPEPFRQFAVIETNDPQRREISFVVEGTVRDEYRVDPPTIELGDIMPDKAAAPTEVVLFSERNEKFSIANVVAPPEFSAKFVPLTAEELVKHAAAKGYRIIVTPVSSLGVGTIESMLQVTIRSDYEDGLLRTLEVPIQGHVAGRLSVTGNGLRAIGEGASALRWLELGTKSYGQGAKAKLTLKVRDDMPNIPVTKIEVEPSFLKVQLSPRPNAKGLYDLLVEVPQDAPPCGHRGDNMGSIRLEFDHPRVKGFSMLVDFSIRPGQEFP